jgi:hypothetical protein
MNTFYHLAVSRIRKGDNVPVTDCLCLNGSAHACTARNKAAVTCPTCLEILKLESRGMDRQTARHTVINALAEKP